MSRRSALRARVLILALAILSIAVAAYTAATFEYRFIDLAVYRWGGEHVLDAPSIYAAGHPTLGMPFTYTPVAALAAPLHRVSGR